MIIQRSVLRFFLNAGRFLIVGKQAVCRHDGSVLFLCSANVSRLLEDISVRDL